MIEKLSDLAFSDNEENVKLCDMLQKSLGVSVFKWFKIGYGNGNGNRYGDGYGKEHAGTAEGDWAAEELARVRAEIAGEGESE